MRGLSEDTVREVRGAFGIHPVYKTVDTCAAEFATETAYLYSTYEEECESRPSDRKKGDDSRRRSKPYRPRYRI